MFLRLFYVLFLCQWSFVEASQNLELKGIQIKTARKGTLSFFGKAQKLSKQHLVIQNDKIKLVVDRRKFLSMNPSTLKRVGWNKWGRYQIDLQSVYKQKRVSKRKPGKR